MKKELKRCAWPTGDSLMIQYHDTEWGAPCHDDKKLFEYILLDTFQAGLSWRTILHKRANFRKAFSNFNARVVARYGAKDVRRLMQDAGIIRNRLKIKGTVANAKEFLKAQKEFGSFDTFIWQFVGGKSINNRLKHLSQIGSSSKESDEMSNALKKRGFKFVGSTICYAFMQGVGMVNDHTMDCFRYRELVRKQ